MRPSLILLLRATEVTPRNHQNAIRGVTRCGGVPFGTSPCHYHRERDQ
jgi:hypothetical protein